MTKDVFVKSISKVAPAVGGVVSGGITNAIFKPSCYKVQNSFNNIKLSDPEFWYYVNKTDTLNLESFR